MNNVTLSDEDVARIEAEENDAGVDFDSLTDTKASEEFAKSVLPFAGRSDAFGTAGAGKIEIADPNADAEVIEGEEEEEIAEVEAVEAKEGKAVAEEEASPDWVKDYLKEKNPEGSFESVDDYKAYLDSQLEKANLLDEEIEANQKVYEIFAENEELTSIIQDIAAGEDVTTAILKHIDVNEATNELKESDPKKYEEVVRAKVLREQKALQEAEKAEQRQKEFNDNLAQTNANYETFKTKNNYSDADMERLAGSVEKHIADFTRGLLSAEFLEVLSKGLNFEAEVTKAKEQGKVEGLNTKVTKERFKGVGDGLPKTKTGAGTVATRSEGSEFKRGLASSVAQSSHNRF